MKFKSNPTHEVRLYIGSKRGYNGADFIQEEITKYVSDFQDEAGDDIACPVRITRTMFVYKQYEEPGWEIAVINYPRAPKPVHVINRFALSLAESLLKGFEQNRISVVFPDEIVMLESDDAEAGHGQKKK
jgi:hypothetical protein